MRICVFTRSLPVHNTGGMELHCWRVACGFAKQGHKVDIFTTSHPGRQKEEEFPNIKIHYVEGTSPGRYTFKWRRDSLREMLKENREKRFNIIYSESSGTLSYLRLKKRGRGEIPVILRLPGTALQEAISKMYQPFSISVFGGFIKNFIHFFRDRGLYPYSDALIACSHEVANALKRELNISPQKVYTVLNGVDTESFNPDLDTAPLRECLGIPQGVKLILCVSRIKKEKGIHLLIRAFKNIQSNKKAKILIIGEGSYLNYLKSLAKRLKVSDNTIFLGQIPKEDLPPYYVLADIVVLPTITREGLPHSILEAMACARPVIATDIGGIRTAITDGIDGLLIKQGDIRELEAKIRLLLDNPELCERLGRRAREKVLSRFTEDGMVEETLSILERHSSR